MSVEKNEFVQTLASVFRRFSSTDQVADVFRGGDYEIVTGFGPTNAPTAGTLSVMLGIIEVQRALKVPATVVISDLGAWNCRNLKWSELCHYRDRMARFLVDLGFDASNNSIRTHLDHDNLVRAGRISRYLTLKDFEDNQEEFLGLYGSEGLLGSRVGLLVDTIYTIADILEPIDRGHGAVLVLSGAEEAYFTRLARIVLDRQATGEVAIGWKGTLGGVYFRVVRGLRGYPKMSKSIPDSALHVGLSRSELSARILSRAEEDQPAIFDAIDLASGWTETERMAARIAYERLPDSLGDWQLIKHNYVDTFCRFGKLWAETAGP